MRIVINLPQSDNERHTRALTELLQSLVKAAITNAEVEVHNSSNDDVNILIFGEEELDFIGDALAEFIEDLFITASRFSRRITTEVSL